MIITSQNPDYAETCDVLINGWFGPGNAGDEAILSSEIALLKKHDMNVIVATPEPSTVKHSHDVPTIPAYSDNPGNWKAVAEDMEHIIIGGGGLVESRNIARKWSSVVEACNKLSIPVHFFGVGVTPPISHLHRQLYKHTLGHASTIIVRDYQSKEYISELGVTTPTYVKPDLAFYHTATAPPNSRKYTKRDRIVIVLRDVPWLNVDVGGLADAITRVYNRISCDIAVTKFVDKESDKRILEEFQSRVEFPINFIEASEFSKLEQAIAESRYVVGMRLHSIVFAAKHGVPFLSVAYNPKCQHVPEQFGYTNVNWCTDINAEAVAEVIIDTWENPSVYNKLAEFAQRQHDEVSNAPTCLDENSKSMSLKVESQLNIIKSYLSLDSKIRRLLDKSRKPAPPSVIPENPKRLEVDFPGGTD